MTDLPILHFGLGPIGCAIARAASMRPGLRLIGGVDIDPAKAGRPLADVAGLSQPCDGLVYNSLAELPAGQHPRVTLHSTSSSLSRVVGEICSLVELGSSVISTCEELSYPFARYPDESAMIDRAAREHGVVVLGTGVNPGFVMDTLAFTFTAVAERVDRVEIDRVVDASQRRLPLQQKIGAGLDLAEFDRRAKAGTLRHVGLEESIRLVAAALGWKVDGIDFSLEPIVAERQRRSPEITAEVGQAAGVWQRATARVDGAERLVYDLKMQLETDEPRDEIRLIGNPSLRLQIPGGINGDIATAAIVVNAIPRVLEAAPGLRTMLDIAPPVRWSTSAQAAAARV